MVGWQAGEGLSIREGGRRVFLGSCIYISLREGSERIVVVVVVYCLRVCINFHGLY
jgi:hypothetical protein